jgi:hypothetical protein
MLDYTSELRASKYCTVHFIRFTNELNKSNTSEEVGEKAIEKFRRQMNTQSIKLTTGSIDIEVSDTPVIQNVNV